MQSNKRAPKARHEVNFHGVRVHKLDAFSQLRRTCAACMMFENNFYEDGETVADRIKHLVPQCDPQKVGALALHLRGEVGLRHAPLVLVRELLRHPKRHPAMAKLIASVIQRADELAEFVAIYWADGKAPLTKQMKRGLSWAFKKFSEYELAKYDRDNRAVKLRDVLMLCHAKPGDVTDEMSKFNKEARRNLGEDKTIDRPFTQGELLYGRLMYGQLETPNTWETRISALPKTDKDGRRAVWVDLLTPNSKGRRAMGYSALLRNLRNMVEDGVPEELIKEAIVEGAAYSKELPFRFIAASNAAPRFERSLEKAMMQSFKNLPRLKGKTAVLVDVSPSMVSEISNKSDLTRRDAASALAMLVDGISTGDDSECRVYAFSDACGRVKPRSGFALSESIRSTVRSSGTLLGSAVRYVENDWEDMDRLIVFTDEESSDPVADPTVASNNYMVNVAVSKNSIASGAWERIEGFSESVVRYIVELEALKAATTG